MSSNVNRKTHWLNRTVLGIGLASLFSDMSHEVATALLPAFLATMGVAAAWLGVIEGVSDGLASFTKMGSGYYTDKLQRRKPILVIGYLITALGTASFGLATQAWQVLIGRSLSWFGRGVRSPVKKAILAAAVTPETYGRAFGFERMMDTLGAIIGPISAFILIGALNHNYSLLFGLTLIPGLIAAGFIAFAVKEKERLPVKRMRFWERLRLLPTEFRKMLFGVGLFGLGAFAHSMLILLAAQELRPTLGVAGAASVAVGLYILHNVCYASFAFVGGWFADRMPKHILLAVGYLMSGAMCICIIILPASIATMALVFFLGGTNVALEETLEDSLSAELVTKEHHGMAFGTLATVNGIGDFASSIVVGALWSAFGTAVAFGYSAILSVVGALVILFLRPSKDGRLGSS
jgi:MFS family permease